MLRGAVDQQRLQRGKKIPGGIAGTRLSRLIGAEFRAQCGQDLFAASHSVAAGFQPLEFGQKIAARRRRQLLQIVLNRIDLYHRKRHFRSLDRNRRSVRRAYVRPLRGCNHENGLCRIKK